MKKIALLMSMALSFSLGNVDGVNISTKEVFEVVKTALDTGDFSPLNQLKEKYPTFEIFSKRLHQEKTQKKLITNIEDLQCSKHNKNECPENCVWRMRITTVYELLSAWHDEGNKNILSTLNEKEGSSVFIGTLLYNAIKKGRYEDVIALGRKYEPLISSWLQKGTFIAFNFNTRKKDLVRINAIKNGKNIADQFEDVLERIEGFKADPTNNTPFPVSVSFSPRYKEEPTNYQDILYKRGNNKRFYSELFATKSNNKRDSSTLQNQPSSQNQPSKKMKLDFIMDSNSGETPHIMDAIPVVLQESNVVPSVSTTVTLD